VSFSALLREDDAVLITLRDVTEERAIASELSRTRDFLNGLIEGSPDAIVAADLQGNILLWNGAAERICGIPRSEIVGKRSVETIYPEGVARDVMRRIRHEGSDGSGRLEALRTEVIASDGEHIPILLSAAIVYDSGKESATVGIFADLRERLKMEERLAAAQQRLAVSEKQVVIAELAGAAAHELNQPLTSIMGYAELLQRRVTKESPAAHSAEVIMREAERMAEIVRKIGRITHYETKEYVGGERIIDLDRATAGPSGDKPAGG
jgi:PAS domain S-box-containing protein